MANSKYYILEARATQALGSDDVHCYIKISDANDFRSIGGWYHRLIDADEASLQVLSDAIASQSFLQWERLSPEVQETADLIAAYKNQKQEN